MALQPPLLVPSGDAENGERIIEAISAHLKRCARPPTPMMTPMTTTATTVVPSCCVIPGIDELILDLERFVTLRDEIVYSFETLHDDHGNGNGGNEDDEYGDDASAAPDVGVLLTEYCALLGALTTVPGLGSLPSDAGDGGGGGADGEQQQHATDVPIGGLFLTWHKLDEEKEDTSPTHEVNVNNNGGGGEPMEIDEHEDADEDDDDNDDGDDGAAHHFSVSSLHAERQLSTYLLAVLQYQSALTNLSVSSSPDSAARVLSDMSGTRDALKAAQLGFGSAAALFDHLRTVVENDIRVRQEEEGAAATAAAGGSASGSMHVDNDRRSFISEASVPMIPISPYQLLDPSALHLFHLASMASGQTCFYYTLLVQRQQMHTVLSKLASGCTDYFEAVASFARQMPEEEEEGQGGDDTNDDGVGTIRSYMPSKALIRSTYAAGELYYMALAEYHEACINQSKGLIGLEVARLRSAAHIIGKAGAELLGNHHHHDLMTTGGGMASQETAAALVAASAAGAAGPGDEARVAVILKSLLCAKVINLHTEISRLMTRAEEEWADDVPTDIPPTKKQIMMKVAPIPAEVNFFDPALGILALQASPPLQQLLDRTGVEACTNIHRKLLELLASTKSSAHRATASSQEELAKLGLPDCISTFKATVEAAKVARSSKILGIPPAMADQLQSLHSSRGVMLLKQNLYILEEVAALARQTLDETEEMLHDTVQTDQAFRRDHPTFSGRDVAMEHSQIAVSSLDGSGATETDARQICSKIRTWLNQANEGDRKLCQVLEEIETDPKYRLVMLPLNQLEKLVRGGSGRLNTDEEEMEEEDRTSSFSSLATGAVESITLEKQLEHLNTLLASRERILDEMENDVLTFNQRERAVQAIAKHGNLLADNQFYQALADLSLPLFDHHFEKINTSIEKQNTLFRLIVQLYTKFQVDRSAYEQEKEAAEDDLMTDTASSPAKAYLQKIASALKTIEWIRPQLVQGRNFYQTVLSNIEELKKKVEDVNAVLASERIFFEDSHHSQREEAHRRRQEEEDERLARELMREAEEAAAQHAPQAAVDPRQQEDDERLARELAQQFQDEANIISHNGTTALAGNRDVAMGDANDLGQGQNSRPLENVVTALGLTEGAVRRIGSPIGRQRSASLDRADENAARQIPPPDVPRRRSSFADLGDIPPEIFASRNRSSSSGRMSQVSLGGVSSIGSESIVRTFHRQQQQLQQGEQAQVLDNGGDNAGENLAGIPIGPSDPNGPGQDAIPAPPSPLGVTRRSMQSHGGGSRSGLPGRSSRPGVVNVRNDEVPQMDVNDEAFAQLVAMDFPPDLVRDALSRYSSLERATEWILSNISLGP